MGVPTSEVGYTPAMPGREDHEVHKGHVVPLGEREREREREREKRTLGDQKFPEASICKYLGIILRSNLNWVDQVNYSAQKAWKVLHFVMRVLKKGNRNTKF